jgi:two-component system capsular synthesis sensor histidine kinase RcsC
VATAFTVTLPVGTVVRIEAPPVSLPSNTRRGRILLVDNDPQVVTILGEMLADAGHHVAPVSGGEDALRVFVPGAFDVVITNLGMPSMNGWEVADRLRSRDPKVPLIFITGWGMQEEDQARCRGLGVAALLFKPVRPAELHAAVAEVLAARAAAPVA